MPRAHTYTNLTKDQLADTLELVLDNPAGTTSNVTLGTLPYRGSRVNYTSHGRVAGDLGKPLNGSAILDDTSSTDFFSSVLVAIPDANTLQVATTGELVEIGVALIEDGNTYNIGTKGAYVYWDLSVGTYVSTQPNDSQAWMPAVLEVLSVGSTTFVARVRG